VTRTNKILIAVVAAGLALCGYYFLLLAPQRKEVTKLDGDIAAKQAEVAQAQAQLGTYEIARKSYKANYATLARLGKAVPADDDVRSLLVQLEATADGTGVDFQKIELGTSLAGATSTTPDTTTAATGELAAAPGSVPVAGGALSAMPFTFTFTGGYFDLQNFFAKLEHFVTVNNKRINATGRLLRLESIAITPASTGFPDMQAEIGAATYIVPPVQGVQGAPTAQAQQASSTPTTPTTPSSPGTTTTATAGAAQ
jgi:Tfp pilus assembly protein PilO